MSHLSPTDFGRLQELWHEQVTLLDADAIKACPNRTGLRLQTGAQLESAFIDLAVRLDPLLSVEIGAHEASFSERLKTAIPSIHALAFEANPHVYRNHVARLRGDEIRVDYRHAAICNHDGSIELKIPTKLRARAIRNTNPISSLLHRVHPDFDYESIAVPAWRLDSVVYPSVAARSVAWIDVEGAQAEVLAGATSFLRHVAALYIEIERQEVWQGQALDDEIVDRLAEHSLIRVMRDNLANVQFNEVYIRADTVSLGASLPVIEGHLQSLRALLS